MDRRYWVVVVMLAVLAVTFGAMGTVAPPLSEGITPRQEAEASSEELGHFINPPSYDSGWVDISDKCGQSFSLTHDLGTDEAFVDVMGRQTATGPDHDLVFGVTIPPESGWNLTYGEKVDDNAYSVVQTVDGGFAIAGSTAGSDGTECWLVKVDSDGNQQWSGMYGGPNNHQARSVVQTDDGGYLMAGYTDSRTGYGHDMYLVKTDSVGNKQWNRTIGGIYYEHAFSVIITSDGGFALAGDAYVSGYGREFWLVKTDSSGNAQWNWTYGETSADNIAECVVQTSDDGYVLSGYTVAPGGYDLMLVRTDAAGIMQWKKTYHGGESYEDAKSVVPTLDGGYAVAGYTGSYPQYDFWLIKTDAAGNELWNKTYGGPNSESAVSVVQVSDGGYTLAGSTRSYGIGTPQYYNCWLVKTDSDGNMLWDKTYGGPQEDYPLSMVQTSDGGYALAGNTGFQAHYDFALIRTDSLGNMQWNKTYANPAIDSAHSIIQTADKGYAIAGYTNHNTQGGYQFLLLETDSKGTLLSNKTVGGGWSAQPFSIVQTEDGGYAIAGYEEHSSALGYEFWVVKIDATGKEDWDRNYGGTGVQIAQSMIQTSGGALVLAGSTNTSFVRLEDFWLVKIDSAGNHLWNKTYGGGGNDSPYSLIWTSDGGFAMAGYTNSFGVDGYDFMLVKTDSFGTRQWNQTYGGTGNELALAVVQTSDGGYAIAGSTNSYGAGLDDFWLVKTDAVGNARWNKTYGGTANDRARSLVQVDDGGYFLSGYTKSRGAGGWDFWLVRTDSLGNMIWNQTYGGTQDDRAFSMAQTSDNGIILAGETYSDGDGSSNIWLVKTYVESGLPIGLSMTALTDSTITLYRGSVDPYWNYIRVRIWLIKEPTWIYGDINMDGVVDVEDLYIVSRNYGKTFSLLSLTGIIAIAGIQTAKMRKKSKQPD